VAQLLDASFVDGVVNRGAAAGARFDDLVAKRSASPVKAWMICGSSSKVMTKASSLFVAEDSKEKIDGSVLLEFDAVADAVGSVQQTCRCAAGDRSAC